MKAAKPQGITTADIGAALGKTMRAVGQQAEKEGWRSIGRARPGGTLFAFNALPAPVQVALVAKGLHEPLASNAAKADFAQARHTLTDQEIEALSAYYDAKPAKAKARAQARLTIVARYQALRDCGAAHGVAARAVCEELGVDKSTLHAWRKKIKGQPRHAWPFLLGDRNIGRTARAQMPAEAWEMLKADYLRRERPTKAGCIGRLRRVAQQRGWVIPATRTLERRLDAIPRALRELAREGRDATQALYPAQVRDKTALNALQIINGDGYKHNLWVEFPDGEIVRAKTWFWQDVYSSKVLTWRTDKTEHTDIIRLSFGDLVERFGIPEKALIDNTLAAANKTMSGGIKHRFRFKVQAEEPLGVFPLMGVRVMWATPGHGQAKPVERVYGIGGMGEIVDKAPDFAGAWTGGNTLDKPDYDGVTKTIKLADLAMVIEREVAAYNAQAGRRSPMHRGRSFDDVFNESYQITPVRRATEAQRRLWLLATEPVQAASRDGAITLQAGRVSRTAVNQTQSNRYWSDAMVDYAGRKVVARFDPQRLHEGVHVYSLDGRYICFADCIQAKGFDDQNAAREHARDRKRFMNAARVQLDAERRMDARDVARALGGAPTSIEAPRGNVVRAEFRDPLERPVVSGAPDTPEEAAARAALAAEMQSGSAQRKVVVFDDPAATFFRCLSIGKRIEDGAIVSDEDRAWHTSYKGSDEWSAMQKMHEDFGDRMASA